MQQLYISWFHICLVFIFLADGIDFVAAFGCNVIYPILSLFIRQQITQSPQDVISQHLLARTLCQFLLVVFSLDNTSQFRLRGNMLENDIVIVIKF